MSAPADRPFAEVKRELLVWEAGRTVPIAFTAAESRMLTEYSMGVAQIVLDMLEQRIDDAEATRRNTAVAGDFFRAAFAAGERHMWDTLRALFAPAVPPPA
jgi:hypothetical protein